MIRRLGLAAVLLLGLVLPAMAGATQLPSLWYWKDGDRVSSTVGPPVTRAKLQLVLDQASDTTHLYVQLGPGTLWCDSTIWLHGNTSLYGMGHGITGLKRSRFSESDVAGAGDVICTAPYRLHSQNASINGATGAPFDSLADVQIIGLTVDGNCTAWPTLNPNVPRNFGISIFHTDSPLLRDIEVRNTLQTGIQFYGCRDAVADQIWIDRVGQETMLGTRNGINVNASTSLALPRRWGEGATLTNIQIRNQKDTAFGFANVSRVAVSNVHITCDHDTTYGNFAFEFEGHQVGYWMHKFNITNIEAVGLANQFLTFGVNEGAGLEDVSISNVQCAFSATGHKGGALNLEGNGNSQLVRFSIEQAHFTNINSSHGDGVAASAAMVYAFNGGANRSYGLRLTDCSFEGADPDDYHSSNPGIKFGGKWTDVVFDRIVVKGAEAEGIYISTGATDTLSEMTLRDCTVDKAQREGYHIVPLGRVVGVSLVRCRAKDTNRNLAAPAFNINSYAATSVSKSIRLEGCRVIRTSGTNMYGIRIGANGGGVADSIWILNNDTQGAVSNAIYESGTPTNVYYSDPTYRISGPMWLPNRESIYWSDASGNKRPFVRVDSIPSMHLYTQAGGNLSIHRSDGTVVVQAAGGSTGDFNVTGGARYQLGGFRTIEKISKTPSFYTHTLDSLQGIDWLDSTGVKIMRLNSRGTLSVPRLGPQSSATWGGAIRIIDGNVFPLTLVGLQAACDEVEAAGGGEVWAPTSLNITLASTPLKVGNRVRLRFTSAYTTLPTFTANASTNVVAAIMPKDTTGGQQYFYVQGAQISGNKGSGGWIGAGILMKGVYVGSALRDCLAVSLRGNGFRLDGGSVGLGQLVLDNLSTASNDDDGILITGAADHIIGTQITSESPATGKAALHITTGGAGTASSRHQFFGIHMEGTNASDGVWLDGCSNVLLDGVAYDGANFNNVVKITGTGTGSDGAFGAAGHTLRNINGNIATIIDDQSAGVSIGNAGGRFVDLYRSPYTNADGRITGQMVGIQPARYGVGAASAATLALPVTNAGSNIIPISGTTGITDVTFTDAYIGRVVTFTTSTAFTITAGNHWKINGNWTANGTGNWDTLTGYVTAGHDFVEIARTIQ